MTAPHAESVSVPPRFNGPPASANGGYVCGVVAGLLGAPAAEVTLRAPPPLDRALAVERRREAGASGAPPSAGVPGAQSVRLLDGEATVAEGRPLGALDLDPPPPVALEAAREAVGRFPWYEGHPFPTCFVCGPRREPGDGLRIFAGSVPGGEVYACPWTPAAEWAERGSVRGEVVWAALDCPSAVAAASLAGPDAGTAVLARLAASIDAEMRAGEPHVVVSWPLGRDGRKRAAGTAILSADGAVRARAQALWIELRAP